MTFQLKLEAALSKAIQIIKESRNPQTGIYWWLPKQNGGWHLTTFYDSIFDDPDHATIWPKYIVPILFPDRKLGDIVHAYAGLPRGRISIPFTNTKERTYAIYHGNDTPVRGGLEQIRRAFNLPKETTKAIFDEHEQRDPIDIKLIKQQLTKTTAATENLA